MRGARQRGLLPSDSGRARVDLGLVVGEVDDGDLGVDVRPRHGGCEAARGATCCETDRGRARQIGSTRLNSSHSGESRMPSSA